MRHWRLLIPAACSSICPQSFFGFHYCEIDFFRLKMARGKNLKEQAVSGRSQTVRETWLVLFFSLFWIFSCGLCPKRLRAARGQVWYVLYYLVCSTVNKYPGPIEFVPATRLWKTDDRFGRVVHRTDNTTIGVIEFIRSARLSLRRDTDCTWMIPDSYLTWSRGGPYGGKWPFFGHF